MLNEDILLDDEDVKDIDVNEPVADVELDFEDPKKEEPVIEEVIEDKEIIKVNEELEKDIINMDDPVKEDPVTDPVDDGKEQTSEEIIAELMAEIDSSNESIDKI
jgi:hypothetical protein